MSKTNTDDIGEKAPPPDPPLKQVQIKTLSVELEDGRVFTFSGVGSITEYFTRIPKDNTLPAKWPTQHQVQAHLIVSQRFRITRPGDDESEPVPPSQIEPQAPKGSS